MKIIKAIKKVIHKTCGKARWLLLASVILFLLSLGVTYFTPLYRYIAVPTDESDQFIHEYPLHNVVPFSINENGDMAVVCYQNPNGVASVINVDTGEQGYCGIGYLTNTGLNPSGLSIPGNIALADSGEIYVLCNEDKGDYLVRVSPNYRMTDKILTFETGSSDKMGGAVLSRLHYFDGHVTFAKIEANGVTLYSIDTTDLSVSTSNTYTTDPNGTYTVDVIPIDGSFLFMRSNGEVYDVGFNEPIGESIYHFDPSDDNAPYFNAAVISDGKLYVAVDSDPVTVYLLEDGELTEVFDTDGMIDDPGDFINIDSYRPAGASHDTLVVCYENGLLAYSDGELTLRDVVLRPNITPLMYIAYWASYLFILPLIGLIINLIIRKKTLLYKQLIVSLPVFIILTIVLAVSVYRYTDSQNKQDIEKDITMICDLATDNFTGYDFSKLMEANEDTGAAYSELRKRLVALGSDSDWSEGYEFSVIYRDEDGLAHVLAADNKLTMPMQVEESLDDDFDDTADLYLASNMSGLTGYDAITDSTIAAYGRIGGADSGGTYYLKVSEDIEFLYDSRAEIWTKIALYCILIIVVLTVLIVLSMLMITRVIKKATKTVKSIEDGDLSARINYKSKDELGQICDRVNNMAISLEHSFEEKDRTEKFYYKFVPERFREYLGKESFTDLTLGDASSRELTVLFCDIRSFSINSEIMTAKENFAFVNTIYGKAGPIVREHNGFIDKYIGDAVMALFENPDDAVACGIDLYRAIVLDPSTAKELNVSDINIGIGIHTGMAMIGIVGESERLSGTVISDTVNLSSRLESLTKQYKTAILVSKDTVDRLTAPDELGLRYLGMIQVAGVNEVKGVYEVLDCLKDDEKEKRAGNSLEFREAMRLFQLGRRDDAAKALERLASEGKDDYVSAMYLEYIRSLSEDDKSNIFRFVRK